MKKETFSEILGDIDEIYVKEAENMKLKNRKNIWSRWAAAAACLCLLVGGMLAWRWSRPNAGGGAGGDAGVSGGDGQWPEGVDPMIASIAQFPATEDIRDVAGAEVIDLELDSLGELGAYLPAQLPGDFFLNKAWLYHTTMKDGTEYHMLRGGYLLPDTEVEEGIYQEDLCVMVYGFRPQVEREIYTREALADYLAGQTEEGLLVTFSTGDVYVNIVNHQLAPSELLAVVDAIP